MITEEATLNFLMWMLILVFGFITMLVILRHVEEMIQSYREGRLQRFHVVQKKMELEAARLAIDERKAKALEQVANALIDVDGRELAAKIELLGDDAIVDALLEEEREVLEEHRT